MKKDYKNIIPKRFHNVSYETDVSDKIKEITTKQIREGGSLYIYGGPGVGKTHTICAIIKNVLENDIDVMFFNTTDFLEQLREEYNKDPQDDEGGLFRRVMNFQGILFLDDIGAEKATEWAIERLYLIINKKYEDMIPIIFTSNCDIEILSARLGDRITSRISEMAVRVQKTGEDRRVTEDTQNEKN